MSYQAIPPAGGGGFGQDTTIPINDSGGTAVNALELIASLTTTTPGATVSRWLGKLLSAGSQVTAFQFDPLAASFPVGSASLPGITFIGHNTTGMHWFNAAGDALGFDVSGTQQMGLFPNLLLLYSATSVLAFGTSQTEKISRIGTALVFYANGAEKMEITSNGCGFNGTGGIAKPTVSGSKGANAALGSLMTALANYGLVTDSTT